ncbi:WxL domain-containing protein [Erysipelothrix anatis]|uniref:WxL domain-containing protein n=1 Tax=Erysipelothrix anatis TaxID=2683713 RepID=UPI0013586028|nr:WxL domain-containing protein [Erysipelothrix anatis]
MRHKRLQKISLIIVLMTAMIIGGFVVNKSTDTRGKVYADTATTELNVAPQTSTSQETTRSSDETVEAHNETEESKASVEEILENGTKADDLKVDVVPSNTQEVRKSETTESQEPQIAHLKSEDTSQQARASLQAHEKIVSNYSELKRLIEAQGIEGANRYTTYYLSADMNALSGGIKVPNNYSFIVDGTNPETGVRHTFHEYRSASYSDTIHYTANGNGNERAMTFRNITIEGQNYYGTLSSIYQNSLITYDNVEYYGPQITHNVNGKVHIHNSDIYIIRGRASAAHEVMEATTAEFTGQTYLIVDSTLNEFLNVTGSITFKKDSTTTISSNVSIVDDTGVDVIIEKGASVDFGQNSSASGSPNYGILAKTLDNSGTLDLNANTFALSGLRTYDKLLNKGSITINANDIGLHGINVVNNVPNSFVNDGGSIHLKADKISGFNVYSYTLYNFNGASFTIDVNNAVPAYTFEIYRETVFDNSTLKATMGDAGLKPTNRTALLHSPIVSFINSNVDINISEALYSHVFYAPTSWDYRTTPAQPNYLNFVDRTSSTNFVHSNAATIETQQINTWNTLPSQVGYPNETVFNADRYIMDTYAHYSLKAGITTSGNWNGTNISSSSPGALPNVNGISLRNKGTISMGNMILDTPIQKESASILEITTNPNAIVRLATTPEALFVAPASGHLRETLSTPIDDGTYGIATYGDFLYRSSLVTYDAEGPLEILAVPTTLSFGNVQLSEEPSIYPRTDSVTIQIRDGRNVKTGWRLSVRVNKPLQIDGNPKSILNEAFYFNQQAIPEGSQQAIVVYETSTTTYDKDVSIEWAANQGVQLFVENYQRVYANTPYHGQLEWILEAK